MKIEIVENLIDEQVERNLEQEKNAQDDKCLSQSFSEFVSDSTVNTTPIKTEANYHDSKLNRKSKIDFKDITLFKHHSFVKIERLSQRQILDWTQKKQNSTKPISGILGFTDKTIIKPAIIKKIESNNMETKVQKSNPNVEKSRNNQKSYGCSYCDKTFTKPHFAKIHERVHTGENTGEKHYACRYCDKKFSQSGSAKIHERIHTGDKPFACKNCNYKTTNDSNLKKHELIHTGEKHMHTQRV